MTSLGITFVNSNIYTVDTSELEFIVFAGFMECEFVFYSFEIVLTAK